MRHIKVFILLTTIVLGFTQCKKESTSATIVGKWVLVSQTWKDYTNNILIGSGTENLSLVGYTIQFNADQTAKITDTSGIYNFGYSINNNTLILDGDNYTIVEFSSNKLVISYENDVTSTTKEVITDTLNRVE